MAKPEFEALVTYLADLRGYHAHGYFGMNRFTIDDGKSNTFDDCKRFSVFKHIDNGRTIELRVENPELARTIDAYFAQQ